MAIVARRNAIIGLCGQDLVRLNLAVRTARIGISRLEKTAAAATAEIV